MGGLESLLTVAENRIPAVAWAGTVPVCSLDWAAHDGLFGGLVRSNYGYQADFSDYASKTAGHDPLLKASSEFFGLPMYCISATNDTTVPPASNWTPFAALVNGTAFELTTVQVTGDHSFTVTQGHADGIVAFANKYAKTL
jgi:hypothetical protein